VDLAARAGIFRLPLDAAPSPDGKIIYFLAVGEGGAGIFSVGADGGAVATLATGPPFMRPSGIAVATDGSRIFAADSKVGASDAPGAILSVPTAGGPADVAAVPGTEGRSVHGLDVVHRDGGDVIYFTGTDPVTGAAGVFQVPAAGGAATTVAEGPPFASLDSVAVTAQGVAYVTDRGPAPGQGSVFRVSGGAITSLLSNLRLGAPAGVALIDDDAVLLVSSTASGTMADQLLFLDLASGATAPATKGIGSDTDSAGGLHRAYNAPVLAWADTKGGVFRIRPR